MYSGEGLSPTSSALRFNLSPSPSGYVSEQSGRLWPSVVSNGGSGGLPWLHRHKVKRGEALVSQASASLLWGEYSGLRSHSGLWGMSLPLEKLSRPGSVHWCSSGRPAADAFGSREASGSRSRGWKEPVSFWSSLTGHQGWWLVKKKSYSAGLSLLQELEEKGKLYTWLKSKRLN